MWYKNSRIFFHSNRTEALIIERFVTFNNEPTQLKRKALMHTTLTLTESICVWVFVSLCVCVCVRSQVLR